MVFSSGLFLFFFLPLVLFGYSLLPWKFRNLFLVAVSLLFYALGEKYLVLVMCGSILFNYFFARFIDGTRDRRKRIILCGVAVTLNLVLLAFYKYTDFFIGIYNSAAADAALPQLPLPHIRLPAGISFFTFHAISYIVDTYRSVTRAEKGPVNTALYISFFPQLIAGPIVRYKEIASQLSHRVVVRDQVYYGLKRFIVGLAKKVIIANTISETTDRIFAADPGSLSSGVAWFGIIAWALYIYFDFSGYSDMAIGLARLFGFRFPENFNYPYISKSITEYWRRWHITLSTWLRDYLYIPLGGNRKGEFRTYINLYMVFVLCGLWHGAQWTFVVFGLFQGTLMCAERLGFEKLLKKMPPFFGHIYFILAILISYVIFRCDSLTHAGGYFKAMLGMTGKPFFAYIEVYMASPLFIFALIAGFCFCLPLGPFLEAALGRAATGVRAQWLRNGYAALMITLFFWSVVLVSSGGYNPFLYFRF